MSGDERIRLFCALELPDGAVARLRAWQRDALADAPSGVRLLSSFHVTLAFLGHRPAREVAAVAESLRAATGAVEERIVLHARRYRETRSVGMVVLDDEQGRATGLAADLHTRLERLGVYVRERRPWLPHVTVARFRLPPRLAPTPPELGEVCPSEAALYHSVLRSGGAQYEVLDLAPLGG